MGSYSPQLQNAIDSINKTRSEIASLKGNQKSYERKLETYRKNYKILIDNEPIVVKMLQVGESSDNVLNALKLSIERIQNIGNQYKLPGFSELLRFDDTTRLSPIVRTTNEEANGHVREKAKKIDELMTETANKITETKNKIDELSMEIMQKEELLYNQEQTKIYYENLQMMESMGG